MGLVLDTSSSIKSALSVDQSQATEFCNTVKELHKTVSFFFTSVFNFEDTLVISESISKVHVGERGAILTRDVWGVYASHADAKPRLQGEAVVF